MFFVRAAEPIVKVGICGGKYMVSGGKEEWRRKRSKIFGKIIHLFLWRRKRRKISWKRKIVAEGMDGTSKALKTL